MDTNRKSFARGASLFAAAAIGAYVIAASGPAMAQVSESYSPGQSYGPSVDPNQNQQGYVPPPPAFSGQPGGTMAGQQAGQFDCSQLQNVYDNMFQAYQAFVEAQRQNQDQGTVAQYYGQYAALNQQFNQMRAACGR